MTTEISVPSQPDLDASIQIISPAVEQYAGDYLDYLQASPTSYHAVDQAAQILEEEGFGQIDPRKPWPSAPGRYFLIREGALVAWIQSTRTSGFSIVAAHTDSPALKLKPLPQRRTADGFEQLMVEVYGGALHNSWVDRELIVAGAISDWEGRRILVRTAPLAFIPQLAPHLDREINQKGLVLDPQAHLQPLWLVDDDRKIMDLVAAEAGLSSADQVAASELFLTPAQAPERCGVDGQFLMGGRQDNLSSTYAALMALLAKAHSNPTPTGEGPMPILALFDHEEVGSGSTTGARGPLLDEVLERIAAAQGCGLEQSWQLRERSTILSADAAHSVNPAFADKHEPLARPVLGRGPVLKVDAGQSYATSLGAVATWRKACRRAGVPNQVFVSHSSKRAGSTVGPLLATRSGIDTVDVGIPLLSMHSTRETSHVLDSVWLSHAIEAYWEGD